MLSWDGIPGMMVLDFWGLALTFQCMGESIVTSCGRKSNTPPTSGHPQIRNPGIDRSVSRSFVGGTRGGVVMVDRTVGIWYVRAWDGMG